MLNRIKISRFKSIKELSLDLGRVNIFIGGNGAGKSNILEAIGICSASIYRGLSDTDLSRKGIRLTPAELMKSALKSEPVAKTLELMVEFSGNIVYKCNLASREDDPLIRFHSESCLIDGVKQFGRSGNGNRVFGKAIDAVMDKDRGMWDQIRAAYKFSPRLVETFSEFGRYSIYTPQTDVLRGTRPGAVDVTPFGLHGEGLAPAVKRVVSDCNNTAGKLEKRSEFHLFSEALSLAFLPGWTNAVRVGTLNERLVSRGISLKSSDMVYFIDKFMNTKRNTLSAYDSSEGTLFLLFIALLLAHKESPRFFGLDNIDNALNPYLTRKMIEKLIGIVQHVHDTKLDFGPKQIFMTSHNPTSLDAFDIFDENQRIFVVGRNEDGATIATRLQPASNMTKEEWSVASGGRNLSQMWLDGLIDGANGYETL